MGREAARTHLVHAGVRVDEVDFQVALRLELRMSSRWSGAGDGNGRLTRGAHLALAVVVAIVGAHLRRRVRVEEAEEIIVRRGGEAGGVRGGGGCRSCGSAARTRGVAARVGGGRVRRGLEAAAGHSGRWSARRAPWAGSSRRSRALLAPAVYECGGAQRLEPGSEQKKVAGAPLRAVGGSSVASAGNRRRTSTSYQVVTPVAAPRNGSTVLVAAASIARTRDELNQGDIPLVKVKPKMSRIMMVGSLQFARLQHLPLHHKPFVGRREREGRTCYVNPAPRGRRFRRE